MRSQNPKRQHVITIPSDETAAGSGRYSGWFFANVVVMPTNSIGFMPHPVKVRPYTWCGSGFNKSLGQTVSERQTRALPYFAACHFHPDAGITSMLAVTASRFNRNKSPAAFW